MLVFTALTALATGLLFGIVPAFRATQTDLKSSAERTRATLPDRQGRSGFTRLALGTQVALSVVLLAAAGLLAAAWCGC